VGEYGETNRALGPEHICPGLSAIGKYGKRAPGLIAVNWSHLRRLSIVMRALEDATIEVRNALNPASQVCDRVMTEYEDDIPVATRPAIEAKLQEIQREIREARNRYGLYTDIVSNRRRLSTKLLILAVDLTECRARYMGRYGEVPDEEAEALDEQVSRLEAMINSLIRLLAVNE
jgi:signal recognition particle subunit SEC65